MRVNHPYTCYIISNHLCFIILQQKTWYPNYFINIKSIALKRACLYHFYKKNTYLCKYKISEAQKSLYRL